MNRALIRTVKKSIGKIRSLYPANSTQERLGYPRNSKLLIIHADDFGLSASQNKATIESFEKGMVNSASIMVTCRGFAEATEYARTHPDSDLGIHLTLTSEWDSYKWGPALSPPEVDSLVDEKGFFQRNKEALNSRFNPEQVENELRAQILLAQTSGVDLTHLDSHMFITTTNSEILDICIKLAAEVRAPLLLTYELPFRYLLRKDLIFTDHLYYAREEDYIDLPGYYRRTLKNLRQGLSCLLIHPSLDNKEMQYLTSGNLSYGSAWRQADFDFFTGEECRNLINSNNIHLITWREVRDKLVLCT